MYVLYHLRDAYICKVTHYLDRIASLEHRLSLLENVAATREELNEARDAQRRLYADMFEETHSIRERLWKLGTLPHQTDV